MRPGALFDTAARGRAIKCASGACAAGGRAPVCLILSPTRELTKQIGKVFETVAAGSLTVLTVYGGVPYDQQEYSFYMYQKFSKNQLSTQFAI